MLISGTGINVTLKVLPDYKPVTKLAIKWVQAADGNWSGTDRGADSDVYEAVVNTYGSEAYIDSVLSQIEANRRAASNVVSLSNFATDETIFGDDVDYSMAISATVKKVGRKRQGSWHGWGVEITFRAISFTFTGSSSFPTLKWCDVGIDGDGDLTINKDDSFDGTMFYSDHAGDAGTFTGVFTLSRADMVSLRRYIATNRTADYTLNDTFGISKPFGSRSDYQYPFLCKLIGWEDLGALGTKWVRVKLVFAEVVGQYDIVNNDYQDTDEAAIVWQDTDEAETIYQM
jgi:hypothetical protein